MDFLDGSDVEEADVDLEEENALLGSDDEEYGRDGVGAEYEYDEEHILQAEDGDVLELELNDEDGLEFGDEPDPGRRNVAPVQVRLSAIPTGQQSTSSGGPNVGEESFDNVHESYDESDHNDTGAEVDEDDDEEDDKNTRSRFQSERNTQQSNSSCGNPIQTLGGRKVQPGDNQRQKQWGNGRPHPHGQGQRQFMRPPRYPHNRNPLLGDRPHPGFNQFRPQMNGPANVQFQEQIFTDFNQPLRPPPATAQGPRPNAPGPRHPGNMNNGGLRPGNNLSSPPRPRQPNPPFPHGNNTNNRQMRPRNHAHGNMNMNQRPPNQWRNQRPERHPFPNQMQNVPQPQMQSGPPPFNQDPRQRPPMFGHGLRPEIRHQVPFNNSPGMNIQPIPPQPFGPGGGMGQQFRMPGGQPELMPPVQPVQPIQQFFHPHHQQHQHQQQPPFIPESHNPQGYWPPQNHENNGWAGPPPPQSYIGLTPNPQMNATFPMHMPIEPVIPNQPPHFMEPHVQQIHPAPAYDQLNQPPAPAYFEPQRPLYHHQSQDHRHNFEHERTQVGMPEVHNRREVFEERSDYRYPRHERMPPAKRKYDSDDRYQRGSPEKRLNGRLGPPVKQEPSAPVRDEKAEELMKIREETRKTMGLGDDYIKKLEDQKRLREQILKKKAEARKKINASSDDDSNSKRIEYELLKSEAIVSSMSGGRPSIYINPKAFRGDLSALNSNLKKVNVDSGRAGNGTSSTKVSQSVKNEGTTGNSPTKPKTILRIVKDKHGNVISRSKVIVRPKQQPSASTNSS